MGKLLKQNSLALTLVTACILLTVCSASAQTLKDHIQNALDKGDTTLAIGLLEADIELDKTFYYNYHVLGLIYFDQGELPKAAEQFKLALKKKKKYYQALLCLSKTQLQLGDLDEAEKNIKVGLKKAKDFKAEFEFYQGKLLMVREDYSDADIAFRRAIAIDDSKAVYHLGLGNANFYQGVPSLAISEYETALALGTASTQVYFQWAEACLQLKDYSCAIEKLKIVLTKDSTYAEAWNRAGGIYYKAARSSRSRSERKARFIDAIGSYKKYIELTNVQPDTSTVGVFFETAMAYASVYGYEDAIPYFAKVLAIPLEPKDIYFWYGKSLWATKDYARAGEMLKKHDEWVSEQPPEFKSAVNRTEYYQLLGDAYFYRKPKDRSNAIKYYKESLKENPDQKRLLQNVAVAYHNLKSYEQAIEYYDLRIAQGIDSSSVNIYRNAGLCALIIAGDDAGDEELDMEEFEEEEAGDTGENPGSDPAINYYELAIDYMSRYLEFNQSDTTVILRVANTYLYQLTDCANGVIYFERLLALNPDNCEAKKSLGFAYFGGTICTKSYSKALRYLLDAYNCLGAPCEDAALVKYIAQCYHLRATEKSNGDTNSDFKNAFEWYGRCLKCSPSDQDCLDGQNDTRFEFNR